jgi:hypothetical protein
MTKHDFHVTRQPENTTAAGGGKSGTKRAACSVNRGVLARGLYCCPLGKTQRI